jgi:hypothetical protein
VPRSCIPCPGVEALEDTGAKIGRPVRDVKNHEEPDKIVRIEPIQVEQLADVDGVRPEGLPESARRGKVGGPERLLHPRLDLLKSEEPVASTAEGPVHVRKQRLLPVERDELDFGVYNEGFGE